MRIVRERRQTQAWKLRVYIDAIKKAEATTDETWMAEWSLYCTKDSVFMSREAWIAVLRFWALEEANKLVGKNAA